MSLFTVREWWGTTPGSASDEEFGGGCLVVGNLDNAADGSLKIATGSFSGLLRLYQPRQAGYQVEDLMVEEQLDAPILQLGAGQLLSDSNRVALAVLHPRSVAVYLVTAMAGTNASGGGGGGGRGMVSSDTKGASFFQITKAYEHAFERPACNFVHGAFGGSYGHEQILIQSMDGVIYVVVLGNRS